jgi:hypothetical protein
LDYNTTTKSSSRDRIPVTHLAPGENNKFFIRPQKVIDGDNSNINDQDYDSYPNENKKKNNKDKDNNSKDDNISHAVSLTSRLSNPQKLFLNTNLFDKLYLHVDHFMREMNLKKLYYFESTSLDSLNIIFYTLFLEFCEEQKKKLEANMVDISIENYLTSHDPIKEETKNNFEEINTNNNSLTQQKKTKEKNDATMNYPKSVITFEVNTEKDNDYNEYVVKRKKEEDNYYLISTETGRPPNLNNFFKQPLADNDYNIKKDTNIGHLLMEECDNAVTNIQSTQQVTFKQSFKADFRAISEKMISQMNEHLLKFKEGSDSRDSENFLKHVNYNILRDHILNALTKEGANSYLIICNTIENIKNDLNYFKLEEKKNNNNNNNEGLIKTINDNSSSLNIIVADMVVNYTTNEGENIQKIFGIHTLPGVVFTDKLLGKDKTMDETDLKNIMKEISESYDQGKESINCYNNLRGTYSSFLKDFDKIYEDIINNNKQLNDSRKEIFKSFIKHVDNKEKIDFSGITPSDKESDKLIDNEIRGIHRNYIKTLFDNRNTHSEIGLYLYLKKYILYIILGKLKISGSMKITNIHLFIYSTREPCNRCLLLLSTAWKTILNEINEYISNDAKIYKYVCYSKEVVNTYYGNSVEVEQNIVNNDKNDNIQEPRCYVHKDRIHWLDPGFIARRYFLNKHNQFNLNKYNYYLSSATENKMVKTNKLQTFYEKYQDEIIDFGRKLQRNDEEFMKEVKIEEIINKNSLYERYLEIKNQIILVNNILLIQSFVDFEKAVREFFNNKNESCEIKYLMLELDTQHDSFWNVYARNFHTYMTWYVKLQRDNKDNKLYFNYFNLYNKKLNSKFTKYVTEYKFNIQSPIEKYSDGTCVYKINKKHTDSKNGITSHKKPLDILLKIK